MDLNFCLSVGVAVLVIYFGYKFFSGGPDVQNSNLAFGGAGTSPLFGSGSGGSGGFGRDIVKTMEKNKKQVVVVYGSQTGTAESYASKLAKELGSKFGIKAMTADPGNYDFETLDQLEEDQFAIFLMASYGEGEPPDNAQEFITFMSSSPEFSQGGQKLQNVNFAVFGLGNSSYEFFNKVGEGLFETFKSLGAKPLTAYGQGDDGKGTLEEDYMAWKEQLFSDIVTKLGIEEREGVYEPAIEIKPCPDLSVDSPDVYLGEPNLKSLAASKSGEPAKGPFSQANPLFASVTDSFELFNGGDRHCIHMEFDVTGLKYTTGDHLAFWCQNSNEEVERFAKALGLTNLNEVFKVALLDSTADVHFPSPTTYDTVIRYYLEINGPVSRQVLAAVVPYAPTEQAKEQAKALANNKELFAHEVTAKCFNLARLMLHLSNGAPWKAVPFSFVVETVSHLQPRYYSISSSSLENPSKLTITAVVERQNPVGVDHEIRGVATNNVLAIANAREGYATNACQLVRPLRSDTNSTPSVYKVPVHVRPSLFKLPAKSETPIIMVGPGTGVAPFRGFVRERGLQHSQGTKVGKALLFFGSRTSTGDFLYPDEWKKHGDWLTTHTAFSREGAKKVYVQHRLHEQAKEVNKLLEEGAVFYVCGDAANMARDVQAKLLDIIQTERGISAEDADKVIRKMRSRNKYQEDVW